MARTRDLLALSMAQAILGACGRVTGASLHGPGRLEEGDDAGITLVSTRDEAEWGSQIRNVWLDVDFIPDVDRIDLGFRWSTKQPSEGVLKAAGDLVSLRLDGRPVQFGNGASGSGARQGPFDDTMDGELSVDMIGRLSVQPGQLTSLRIAASDIGADIQDAELRVFSESAANPSQFIAIDDSSTVEQFGTTTVNLTANDIGPGQSDIYVTAINGQPLEPGESVTLTTGQTVTLLDDGTVSIAANGIAGDFSFDYTAAYGRGNAQQTDIGSVEVDTVPCFVAGTMIRALGGVLPVERLSVGDLVHTRDNGLQPIRWIGRRRIAAEGPFAPIRIGRDSLGRHDTLFVSPLHRILVRNANAQLLYGTVEVLAAARDLVDDDRIQRIEGGYVEYVHLMFDEHQIIWSDGLETESFLPGPQTTCLFEAEIVNEITTLFPELNLMTGRGYGPSARPALRSREARLLVA